MMMMMMVMVQATDLLMNTVSLYGMLVSNLVNWSWQAGYLATLTVQVIIPTLFNIYNLYLHNISHFSVCKLRRAPITVSLSVCLLPDAGSVCEGELADDNSFWVGALSDITKAKNDFMK